MRRLRGREVDKGLDLLRHNLLDKNEAPELELEPIEVLLRAVLGAVAGSAGERKRINTEVGDVGHVRMGLFTQLAMRLVKKWNL